MIRSSWVIAAVAWAATLLVGCSHSSYLSSAASMRIEVDVYKGPLSSPIEIQKGQLGAILRATRRGIEHVDGQLIDSMCRIGCIRAETTVPPLQPPHYPHFPAITRAAEQFIPTAEDCSARGIPQRRVLSKDNCLAGSDCEYKADTYKPYDGNSSTNARLVQDNARFGLQANGRFPEFRNGAYQTCPVYVSIRSQLDNLEESACRTTDGLAGEDGERCKKSATRQSTTSSRFAFQSKPLPTELFKLAEDAKQALKKVPAGVASTEITAAIDKLGEVTKSDAGALALSSATHGEQVAVRAQAASAALDDAWGAASAELGELQPKMAAVAGLEIASQTYAAVAVQQALARRNTAFTMALEPINRLREAPLAAASATERVVVAAATAGELAAAAEAVERALGALVEPVVEATKLLALSEPPAAAKVLAVIPEVDRKLLGDARLAINEERQLLKDTATAAADLAARLGAVSERLQTQDRLLEELQDGQTKLSIPNAVVSSDAEADAVREELALAQQGLKTLAATVGNAQATWVDSPDADALVTLKTSLDEARNKLLDALSRSDRPHAEFQAAAADIRKLLGQIKAPITLTREKIAASALQGIASSLKQFPGATKDLPSWDLPAKKTQKLIEGTIPATFKKIVELAGKQVSADERKRITTLTDRLAILRSARAPFEDAVAVLESSKPSAKDAQATTDIQAYAAVAELAGGFRVLATAISYSLTAVLPGEQRLRIDMVKTANMAAEFANQLASRANALTLQTGPDGLDRRVLPTGQFLREIRPTAYLDAYDWLNAAVDGADSDIAPEDRIRTTKLLFSDDNWAQVNEVYASGAGDVSMAFIRDEVGNWNLKAFSSDATRITQAYTALGLDLLETAASAASGGSLKGLGKASELIAAAQATQAGERPGEVRAGALIAGLDLESIRTKLADQLFSAKDKLEVEDKRIAAATSCEIVDPVKGVASESLDLCRLRMREKAVADAAATAKDVARQYSLLIESLQRVAAVPAKAAAR